MLGHRGVEKRLAFVFQFAEKQTGYLLRPTPTESGMGDWGLGISYFLNGDIISLQSVEVLTEVFGLRGHRLGKRNIFEIFFRSVGTREDTDRGDMWAFMGNHQSKKLIN